MLRTHICSDVTSYCVRACVCVCGRGGFAMFLWLLVSEAEGSMLLWHIGNYAPNNTASCPNDSDPHYPTWFRAVEAQAADHLEMLPTLHTSHPSTPQAHFSKLHRKGHLLHCPLTGAVQFVSTYIHIYRSLVYVTTTICLFSPLLCHITCLGEH